MLGNPFNSAQSTHIAFALFHGPNLLDIEAGRDRRTETDDVVDVGRVRRSGEHERGGRGKQWAMSHEEALRTRQEAVLSNTAICVVLAAVALVSTSVGSRPGQCPITTASPPGEKASLLPRNLLPRVAEAQYYPLFVQKIAFSKSSGPDLSRKLAGRLTRFGDTFDGSRRRSRGQPRLRRAAVGRLDNLV
jgi:hypothetical protein